MEALSASMSCDIKSLTWYDQIFRQIIDWTILLMSCNVTPVDHFTMPNLVNMPYKYGIPNLPMFTKRKHAKGQVWPSALHFFVKIVTLYSWCSSINWHMFYSKLKSLGPHTFKSFSMVNTVYTCYIGYQKLVTSKPCRRLWVCQ